MESFPKILILLGIVLTITGKLWLSMKASHKGGPEMGMMSLLLGWAGPLAYCIEHKDGWIQFGLMVSGVVMLMTGFVLLRTMT